MYEEGKTKGQFGTVFSLSNRELSSIYIEFKEEQWVYNLWF